MKIVELPLAEIRRYENNPRNNDRSVNRVAASIKDFGFTNPIILDREKTIVCGDTRNLAAMKLQMRTVPCIVCGDLTEAQTAALRIADNKTAEIAGWDRELLRAELASVGLSVDMEALGFDAPKTDDSADEDGGDGAEIETVTRPGCVWRLGRHRLMCGDSTKAADVRRLMDGKTAAMSVTDPPYNVDYEGASCGEKIANDRLGDGFQAFLLEAMRRTVENTDGPVFAFIGRSEMHTLHNAFTLAGGQFGFWGIWAKKHFTLGRSDYQRRYEPYLYGWAGASKPKPPKKMADVVFCRKPQKSALHPTMKPVALFEEIIKENCPRDGLVLDLFGGSGTTLVAAQRTGRTAFAMELSPVFCDRIVERFRADFGEETCMEGAE